MGRQSGDPAGPRRGAGAEPDAPTRCAPALVRGRASVRLGLLAGEVLGGGALVAALGVLGLLVVADGVLEGFEADDPDARAEGAVAAMLLDVATAGTAAAAIVAAAATPAASA